MTRMITGQPLHLAQRRPHILRPLSGDDAKRLAQPQPAVAVLHDRFNVRVNVGVLTTSRLGHAALSRDGNIQTAESRAPLSKDFS